MSAPPESPEEHPILRRANARVGHVLRGKWRLDRLLGVGGMASVYEATHRNGKRGAVKMLHLEYSGDGDARNRFLREGYVANRVDHPGAVSVLDDDVAEDGSVFIVMELLEGKTVDALMHARPDRRLDVATAVDITAQLLEVLAAAHAKGIVHRDLKPENVFVTHRGEVKVLDFGIARLRELSGAGAGAGTKTGSVMGTPAYMPPEQALGNWDSVDARTDLWAVGATLFAMLSGRPVHVADTINKLLLAAMTQRAPAIASVLPGLSPGLAQVVDTALWFEQEPRFPDAQTMLAALRLAVPGASLPGTLVLGAGLAPATPGLGASPSAPGLARAASAPQPVEAQTSTPVGTHHGVSRDPSLARPRGVPLAAWLSIAAVVVSGAAAAVWSWKGQPPASAALPEATSAVLPATAAPEVAPALPPAGSTTPVAAAEAPASPLGSTSATPGAPETNKAPPRTGGGPATAKATTAPAVPPVPSAPKAPDPPKKDPLGQW
jgi:hypothetical protein